MLKPQANPSLIMAGDNFVERVHAYSKWALGLEPSCEDGEESAIG